MGDTFSNISNSKIVNRPGFLAERAARVALDEKIAQIRMYLADHADDTLEEGERAIFTDITTILDGE